MVKSVIIPTYNRPKELLLCLTSLSTQSVLPDEVLIADDGSKEDTKQTIEQFSSSSTCPFPVKHIWQEDDGFRKPRILNETVRNTAGDYLLFLDGDCLAHPDWLKHHLLCASPKTMLGGKRIDLGQKLSRKLLDEHRLLNQLNFELVWDSITSDTRKVEEAFVIKSPILRNLFKSDRISDDGIWGCNFSVSKDLFYAINGCDEDFLDGSIEDNDLGIRVLNSGGKLRSVRHMANVFHLWHKASWSFENEKYQHNMSIITRRMNNIEPRCRNGIVPE